MDIQNQSEDHVLREYYLNNKQFLKRTWQFVLSVSVFSVFVWYSSGLSIHPQSFNAYFSTCLFYSMITHTLERKYMFLICNGILAFVAKTSLRTSNSSDSADSFDHLQNLSETKTTAVSDMVVVPLGSFESPENVPLMVEEQQGENNEEVSEADEDQEESHITEEEDIKEEDEEGEAESEAEVAQDYELEETTTTNEELVNTEELNRKFEEFIRKMKEEIRIEAQRQLIAV
ncbi:hypothetical protein AAZX31_09G012600 [Glycine max]|uniref:DUF4408 domain-containing protein n=2 Tax=Glycine subgen. Soja TaxID=1462606 RepID=K7LB85_SOYBN|nr:uncharacterized protein LOC102666654 [Glycine max]XP_028180704.1 uncharacterized protein LOC114367706 [Glycine soja]KAG5005721.1 hypothetical protein JHK85_024263 [Glycine max]KAG5011510.1 hypothetical protein JHK86_023771 [Glycine max]KAG5132513.1 hypothetical protein JHK82_023701 [Glycine max]KAH1040964.1 hypothetical protein GYH30_023698 [Glycine max]KAH1231591.1 hypothetical protein GmHk_09G024456 [Glycine max]|eukprot:XP_006586776.1 uncharacterized protein LOC102666654 [Glycine max]